jgi:hypothetical protein
VDKLSKKINKNTAHADIVRIQALTAAVLWHKAVRQENLQTDSVLGKLRRKSPF